MEKVGKLIVTYLIWLVKGFHYKELEINKLVIEYVTFFSVRLQWRIIMFFPLLSISHVCNTFDREAIDLFWISHNMNSIVT